MRTTVKGNSKTFEFDSIDEAIKEALRVVKAVQKQGKTPPCSIFLGSEHSLMREDLKTWGDVESAMSKPWSDGLDIIERLRKNIPDQDVDFASTRRRKRNTSMDEGEVNLDSWLAGRCDYFDATEFIKVHNDSQFIHLAFTNSAPGGISGDQIFLQAAALIAAVDKLESQGHQVQLSVYAMGSGLHEYRDRRNVIIRAKEAGEPVNMESLVTVLSPWFFRLISLTLETKDVELGVKTGSGLGCPEYDFDKIASFIPDAQMVERSFRVEGAVATYHQLSSMVQGGSKDGEPLSN